MSQFSCPLCGKNSSITNYDPSSLDYDLKIVSYGSTGRGGIHVVSKESVLGEGSDIEKSLAIRNLQLTKMFRDHGILSDVDLFNGLGLVKYLNKKETMMPNSNLLNSLESNTELVENRKIIKDDLKRKKILLELKKLTRSKIVMSKKTYKLFLVVYELHDTRSLIWMFIRRKKVEREKILKMLIIKDPSIKKFFNVLLSYPEIKPIFQKMYEGTYNPIWDDPDGIDALMRELYFGKDPYKVEQSEVETVYVDNKTWKRVIK